jgi:hypothetical protein
VVLLEKGFIKKDIQNSPEAIEDLNNYFIQKAGYEAE